ncbi:MAG: hypothetical protein QOF01_2288 [Thermomicrobiales bacterium]|nr:hypothetical protein [Thermomicrobiales bacterium]
METRLDRREVRRGFVALLPLGLSVVPFAIAFAVLARTSGLSTFETGELSLFVFAGIAQLAFVNLAKDGSGGAAILVTVLLLNLRHVLYGLSLDCGRRTDHLRDTGDGSQSWQSLRPRFDTPLPRVRPHCRFCRARRTGDWWHG